MSTVPPSPEIEAEALRWISELVANFPMSRCPGLEWRRFRTTAGVADYRRWTIGLSQTLMCDAERLRRTIFHEYAHLLAVDRHGRKGVGHGAAWQQAMRDLGEVPEVRHAYECPRNQPRQVVIYQCARCGKTIERVRRLPQRRKYYHVNCGGVIQFVHASRVTLVAEAS